MGDSSTLSFRVESDIIDRLDDAAADNSVSRSQLAREALLVGLQEMDDGDGDLDVPDHLAHDAKVRQMLARNKKKRRRGKFRSEFSRQLKASFERGETPAEFRDSVAGYIEEAREMGDLPEGVKERTSADVDTFSEWVDSMLEYYAVAYESQTFDHDPVDNPLGNHEGVQNARQWVKRAEAIATTTDYNGGDTPDERRRRLAENAREDGVLPEWLQQQVEDVQTTGEADPRDVIVDAAIQTHDTNRTLTDTEDTPQIE